MGYLDEEWEKKDRIKRVKMHTLDFIDGTISVNEARRLAISYVYGASKEAFSRANEEFSTII